MPRHRGRRAIAVARSHRRAAGRARGIHRHRAAGRACRRCSSPAPSIPDRAARTIRTARSPPSSPRADAPEPRVAACRRRRTPLPAADAAVAGRVSRRCACAGSTSRRSSRIPNNPNSATEFYITVDGQTPSAVRSASPTYPNIVVQQGDVEDWIIENRSTELHAFHIHQIHFLLMDWSGVPVNEPFLRDTVNVPYYNGRMLQYPSVRLRMDFRDPEHRRHIRLSLPPARTRGRRHDGTRSASIRATRRDALPLSFDAVDDRRRVHRTITSTAIRLRYNVARSRRRQSGRCLHETQSNRVAIRKRVRIGIVLAGAAADVARPDAGRRRAPAKPRRTRHATSPIKHVIVIIGENRSFDHVFATYVPKNGETRLESALRGHRQRATARPDRISTRPQQHAASDPGTRYIPAEPAARPPSPTTYCRHRSSAAPKDSYIPDDSLHAGASNPKTACPPTTTASWSPAARA